MLRYRHHHPRVVPVPKFFAHDATKPTGDPTGTAGIRKRYKRLLDLRWRKFRGVLRTAVAGQDVLNLTNKQTALSGGLAAYQGHELIEAFQTLVDGALKSIMIEKDAAYLDPMTATAYRNAVSRGVRLAKSKALPDEMTEYIFMAQRFVVVELQGIVEGASQAIVKAASLALLDGHMPARVMAESSKAIDAAMVRSRAMVEYHVVKTFNAGTLDTFAAAGIESVVLIPELRPVLRAAGVVAGAGGGPDRGLPGKASPAPALATRDARAKGPGSRVSRKVGPSARTLRRIKAMERELAKRFKAKLWEVRTAGDELVCPVCEDIESGGPYTIDEARSLIPAHPNCRCAFVPAD